MAQKGLCSRREAERHIENGRVKVNGQQVTVSGTPVDPENDLIELDLASVKHTTIAFHKPRGIMSNCPQPGQKEIRDLLPKHLRDLSTIGRLDRDSEGIILLTNDGRVAKYYLAAEKPHERSYHVWIDAPLHIGQKNDLNLASYYLEKKPNLVKLAT